MPGFLVNGLGGHRGVKTSGRREYYYTYFWEINNLFETYFTDESPLIALKDAGLPTFTVNKETYVGSSLEYKWAKNVTWDDIKVSWYDSVGLLDVISNWRRTVWTPELGLQAASDYKKNSTITAYLPTGLQDQEWRLFNSWPSSIKHGDLTYTNSEVKFVEITVTYDWAERIRDFGRR